MHMQPERQQQGPLPIWALTRPELLDMIRGQQQQQYGQEVSALSEN
jgi:hypothetical protein